MRDEDFEIFVENFGEATHREAVPELSFEKFRGVLPQQLLNYWKEEGWCGYAKGLVWTVNPEKYSGLVKLWLADTPYEKLDAFHVIARSAFGDLYAWGERTNRYVVIGCPENALIAMDKEFRKVQKKPDLAIRVFFSSFDREDFDLEDETDKWLFKRALKNLGPLGPNEVYGFEPALVMGGPRRLENLGKLDLFVHLAILRQFAAPVIPFAGVDPGPSV